MCRTEAVIRKAGLQIVPAHTGNEGTDVHIPVRDGSLDVQIAGGRLTHLFQLESRKWTELWLLAWLRRVIAVGECRADEAE